jgi:hypothetical protein
MPCTNDLPLPLGHETLSNGDIRGTPGIPLDVPVLVTLRCPHCRGGKWQILAQGLPHELVCERCGSTLDFELQS